MTIRNILRKVSFHPFLYITLFICIITGYLKEGLLFTIFIIVHEMGHILAALYYNWHIDKIILLPFGGMTIFKEKINKPLKEEGMIAIAGLLFQTIFYIPVIFLTKNEMVKAIHYGLLFFNLLPIYPLDGSKILHVGLHHFFSFKNSYIILFIISIGTIFFLLIYMPFNLLLYSAFFLLFLKVCREIMQYPYTFQKFLLERYLYHFSFSKTKKIHGKNVYKMQKDHKHIFMVQNKSIKEQEILANLFDNPT